MTDPSTYLPTYLPTALYLACEQGYKETAALLLEAGAKSGGGNPAVDRYGATAYA